MSEWREVAIGELCEGIYDGPHATPKKTSSGPIFLGISNLSSGRLDLSTIEHISEEDYAIWTKRIEPKNDDLVFSYETRLGEAALLPKDLRCCLGRRMALMRFRKDQADPRFMLYAYLSPQFQAVIKSRTVPGSTVDRIPLIEFPKFPIVIPKLATQHRIAAILSTFDDKIELNRHMNRTLEQMARALFKSWFVDFDPVRSKMEGRTPEGMDAETAALFPDRLVEVDGREVPEGWELSRLDDLLILQRGFDLPADQREKGSFPVYAAGGLHGYHSKPVVSGPGVVTGRSGVIGNVFYVAEDYWPLNTTLWVKELKGIGPNYAFELLRAIDFTDFTSGSAVPTLNRNHIHCLSTTKPPIKLAAQYEIVAANIRNIVLQNDLESTHLAQLRDSLLPRLLSGEVDVSGWGEGSL